MTNTSERIIEEVQFGKRITQVVQPVYSSPDNCTIDCIVTFNETEVLPYTASATDTMPYGIELYAELIGGCHGLIAPYIAPQIAIAPAVTLKIQVQTLLINSDMVALRCWKAGISFPAEWQTYVLVLRAIISTGTGAIPATPAYPAGS